MNTPKRIIVRAPNWIGDHVMALPFYWDLRKTYPQAELVLLSLDNLTGLSYPKIFADHWTISGRLRHSVATNWQLSRRISEGKFDLAFSLPSSVSSALLFFLAGVPQRVGFADKGSEMLYSASLPWEGRVSGKHKSEIFRDLLRFATAHPMETQPEFDPATTFEGSVVRQNIIVVAPGASIPLREWPFFRELLVQIRKQYWAFRVVVVGSQSEVKWHGFLSRLNDKRIEDWVGKTTLSQLIELCRTAKLVIANDSGIAHLAATIAKAPTIAVFGPGDPDYVSPVGEEVEVVREDVSCSPCESTECGETEGYQQCLRKIPAERVMSRVESLLPLN